jgi:hypothetical protein
MAMPLAKLNQDFVANRPKMLPMPRKHCGLSIELDSANLMPPPLIFEPIKPHKEGGD